MRSSLKYSALYLVLVPLTLTSPALADFQYQETTQITGGSAIGIMKFAGTFSKSARQASEPIVSEVLVKGNRMARINKDTTEITDLDRETITTIDNIKHEYSVITFEEMRQQIQKAMHDAQQHQQQESKSKATTPPPDANNLTFDVHVRKTGATKQISGVAAEEAILTMTMQSTDKASGQSGGIAITNDMWMAQEIAGYEEIRDFERRYALKIGSIFTAGMSPAMLTMQPGVGQGMASMAKEMSKLKGIPVQQITRTGITANGQPLPAASESPLPTNNSPQMPSAGDVAQQTATTAIASKLGTLGAIGSTFGRFAKKKKEEAPPPDSQLTPAQTAAASVLLESNTQYTTLSAAHIDPSRFEVPAGFKKVDRKMMGAS